MFRRIEIIIALRDGYHAHLLAVHGVSGRSRPGLGTVILIDAREIVSHGDGCPLYRGDERIGDAHEFHGHAATTTSTSDLGEVLHRPERATGLLHQHTGLVRILVYDIIHVGKLAQRASPAAAPASGAYRDSVRYDNAPGGKIQITVFRVAVIHLLFQQFLDRLQLLGIIPVQFTEQVFQPDLHVRDVKTFLLQGRQRVYEIHALRYTEILYAKGTRLYSVLYDRG